LVRAFHQPCQQAGSTGGANGSRHEGVFKPNALGSQPIYIRRLEKRVQDTQHVEALIVGRDEQQIGSLHDLPFLADRGLLRIAADKQQGEYQQRVSSHGINYHAF
jgi:hypothetical protein